MNKKLIAWVHGVMPLFQESGPWYLMHDNALVHSSGIVSVFWQNKWAPCYPIHPAPPDLLPAAMKGARELKVIQEEVSSRALNLLHERRKLCLEVARDYIEWWYQYNFLCGFMVSVWEFNCHTVYLPDIYFNNNCNYSYSTHTPMSGSLLCV